MIDSMSKKRKPQPAREDKVDDEDFPSRSTYKGTYLPKELYEELDRYAAADDRSAAFLVRKAVVKLLIELRKSGPPGPSIRKSHKE